MKKLRSWFGCFVPLVLCLTSCYGRSDGIVAKWRDASGKVIREQKVALYGPQGASDLLIFKQDGKVGLADMSGNVIADALYDNFYINDKRMPFIYELNSLFGYIDIRTGERMTPPIFTRAGHFYENRAAVSIDGKKMGYIDSAARMVIAPQWDLVSDFYQGMAKVVLADDLSSMFIPDLHRVSQISTPGKTGFIDRDGSYIIPPEYSFIDINQGEPYLRFNRGEYKPVAGKEYDLTKVYPGSKWGLMDLRGNVIIPDTTYDYIFPLWVGDRYLFGVEKQGRYSVLDPATWQPMVPWKKYASPEKLVEAYYSAVNDQ